MKKTKKKILGFLGLVAVVVMTVIAYSIPSPGVGAVSSFTDTIIVHVYDRYPKITITNPTNEEILVGADHIASYDWENSTSADFILTFDGTTVTSWHDDYGSFEPGSHPVGSGNHAITLNEYGRYILSSTAVGPIGSFEDSVIIYRLATSVSYIDATTDNDPNFEIDYDDQVAMLEIQVFDENGNPIFAEPILVPAQPGGVINYTIDMPDGSNDGTYQIVVRGLDELGEEISDPSSTEFEYIAPAPDIPDTGFSLTQLNIAKSDFLITGLLIFFSAAIAAIFLVNRKKER
ncbi:hypothetical protein IJF86_03215 [Candidatus Saccharibacteria bacterium]|nr:hypothetical protein [Candidatus Saccharibacteria bacterium]